MKFSCLKENLSPALSLVSGVVGRNPKLPILNNVLIKVKNQQVELVATNLEVAVQTSLRAKVEHEGAFTVPARTIVECVQLLPNARVDIELKNQTLEVVCGSSHTALHGSPPDDFPVIPEVEAGSKISIEAAVLGGGLEQVLPAAAKTDVRPELSGVALNFSISPSSLTLAATDSYRLAERKINLSQPPPAALRIIIPTRTAAEIIRILAAAPPTDQANQMAELTISENQLALSFFNTKLVSRLVAGQYPDYTQIIPRQFSTTSTLARSGLVQEVKAASLFTTGGVSAVMLHIFPERSQIEVAASSPQTGEHHSELAAKIEGHEQMVALNQHYLLEGLQQFAGEAIELKVVNPESPCVLGSPADDNYLYLIMPIRQ